MVVLLGHFDMELIVRQSQTLTDQDFDSTSSKQDTNCPVLMNMLSVVYPYNLKAMDQHQFEYYPII